VAAVYPHNGQLCASGVLPYSLGAYCTASAANSTDPAMVAVGQTAAVYGYYAKRYFRVLSYKEQYIPSDGAILRPGQSMPEEPSIGDVYIADGYTYRYGYIQQMATLKPSNISVQWVNADLGGWSVTVNDRSRSSYGEILSNILGKPVVSMRYTFANCTNMITAPVIPETIRDMTGTFYGCTALTGEITILAQFCEVADCGKCCILCSAHMSLPCEKCRYCGAWVDCFAGTVLPIALRGTCNRQYELAATGNNGNVTVLIPLIRPVEPPLKPEIM
jgi:hypothetical protein